ncbi:MAG: rhodanese-like domain-containing protein [Gammaproteobacteria bacterium]
MPWLINATQLDKFRKSQKSVMILDASWHLPATDRNAKQEFLDKHIIDAHFFDLNLFHDTQTDIPNTLITDEPLINEKLSALGIRDDYKIIIYDNSDLHSACRALWMFRIFGHNPHQLYILDGGLPAWEKYGGKLASGETSVSTKPYTASLQPALLRALDQMKANVTHPAEQVIDLRHPVRFAGGADPRADMRVGHIPGSFSFPYMTFFDKEGCFSPLEKIRKQLSDTSVDLTAPIITTCGSGMTAPILNFVLDLMNHPQHALYDGSWSEWGTQKLYSGEKDLAERPVETCIDG